jgi:hypothetical protein
MNIYYNRSLTGSRRDVISKMTLFGSDGAKGKVFLLNDTLLFVVRVDSISEVIIGIFEQSVRSWKALSHCVELNGTNVSIVYSRLTSSLDLLEYMDSCSRRTPIIL